MPRLVADPGRRIVIEERQRGVAHARGHRQRLVDQRAGENHRPAGGCPVGAAPEFGKAQVAALVLLGIEVDGDREAAMLGRGRGVVAVREEEAAVGTVIAGDDVALDPRRVELEGAVDHRDEAPVQAALDALADILVLDQAVAAALARTVQHADGAVAVGGHVPRRGAALGVIVVDQRPAEAALEYPRHDQDRGPGRGPAIILDRRQPIHHLAQRRGMRSTIGQRNPHQDAECGVEDDGLRHHPGRVAAAVSLEGAGYAAVEILEPAYPRHPLHQPALRQVEGVARHPEEGDVEIVETPAMRAQKRQHRLARRRRCTAEEADDDESAGDGIEIEARIAVRRRREPGRRITRPQPAIRHGEPNHGVVP